MHESNLFYWKLCKKRRPWVFKKRKVVEFGSRNQNGTVRILFKRCGYIGVDCQKGACVDIISLAHTAKIERSWADVVISASMLEHDPHWEKSLRKAKKVLKSDGILYLSWGSALNDPHPPNFHSLKAGMVLSALKDLGFIIEEFLYEAHIPGVDKMKLNRKHPSRNMTPGTGLGEVVLTAVLREEDLIMEPFIDKLLPEDEA